MHLPSGAIVLGRYEVLDCVGHGTWKVRDQGSNEIRALKRLTLRGVPDGQALGEAVGLRRGTDIPGVPAVLDLQVARIDDRDEWLLVREWVEGETLTTLVERHGGLNPDHVRWLGGEILWVLERIHEAGRVHGDIQPDNIVLAKDGTELWLVDAAPMKVLARQGASEGWRISARAEFAAPELSMGGATPRSDIYAVGTTLLNALTARPPAEVNRRALTELARQRQYQIDRQLVDVVLRMAQPLADGRFESVPEATHALAHGLEQAEDREWWKRDFFLHPDDDARRNALQTLLFGGLLAGVPVVAAALVLFPPLGEILASFATVGKALVAIGVAVGGGLAMASSVPWIRDGLEQMVHVTDEKLSVKTSEGWLRVPWDRLGRVRRLGPALVVEGSWELDDTLGGGRDALVLLDVYDVEQGKLRHVLEERRVGQPPPRGDLGAVLQGIPGLPPQLQLAVLVSGLSIPLFAFLAFAWSAGALHGQNDAVQENAWANQHAGQRGEWTDEDVPGAAVTGGVGDVPRLVWAMECPPGMFAGSVLAHGHRVLSCDDLNGTMVTVPGVSGTAAAPFLADRAEVSVAEYQACVTGGTCAEPEPGPGCNFGDASRTRHPINCVGFQEASAYCGWAHKRLCTGDEFERLAGALHGHDYPWGDASPSCDVAVMDDEGPGCGKGGTWPAGSHVDGASPLGGLDVAGNVAEWTADTKTRGGSYASSGAALQTTAAIGGVAGPEVGFRCCLGF